MTKVKTKAKTTVKSKPKSQTKPKLEIIKIAKRDNRPAPKPENKTKSYREQRQKAKELKAKIYEVEKTNRKYLHAYEYKPGWWRFGGISALKYYYDLSHENGHKDVRKNTDRDYENRWASGHITFNSLESLVSRLKAAGIPTCRKMADGWIRFTLPKPMHEEDIKRLFDLDKHNQEAANQLLMPKNDYPEVYTLLRQVSQELTEGIRKLDATKRELYGGNVAPLFERSKVSFICMANGNVEPKKFFQTLLERTEYALAWLLATNDYQIFANQQQLLRIANHLLALKDLCKDILHKSKEKEK